VNQNGSAWQSLYDDAVAEFDQLQHYNCCKKFGAAQRAIGDRLQDALHGRNPIDADERQAIEDARYNLHFLKKHPAA
jgi:hypothetical protein